MRKDLHEANRLSWNAATQAHNSHKIDQAGFLRRGGSTLFAEKNWPCLATCEACASLICSATPGRTA